MRSAVSMRVVLLRGRESTAIGSTCPRRLYAKDPFAPMSVFDRNMKRLQREASTRRADKGDYDYLRNAIADRVSDRIRDICVGDRKLPNVLDLGANRGHLWPQLRELQEVAGIKSVTAVEYAPELLRSSVEEDEGVSSSIPAATSSSSLSSDSAPFPIKKICASEDMLPFPDATFDLVISSLSLHWVNDLPASLREILRVLKPDGVFVGAMFGEQTLQELRSALVLAEQERQGGLAAHISPMAGVGDVGNLLNHTGFALPTVDQETIQVDFADPFVLMHELKAMGEQHAPSERTRHKFTPLSTFAAAAAVYQSMYSFPAPDGTYVVPATFQVVYMIGWAPHESQPKPKRRGSQTHSFKDINDLIPST